MEKGQICYAILGNDIEPVNFIEECNPYKVYVKSLNSERENIGLILVMFVILKKRLIRNYLVG